MKDATLDPSVNAHKSSKSMWVCPRYSAYRVDRQRDNLRKFETVLSVLSLQKNLHKEEEKQYSITPLTFNYQLVNIL